MLQVFSGVVETHGVQGLRVIVQSDKRDPEHLDARIEHIFGPNALPGAQSKCFRESLIGMSAGVFQVRCWRVWVASFSLLELS
jgi:hypothetical protein